MNGETASTTEVPRDWPECAFDDCHGAQAARALCLRHTDEADARQVIERSRDIDLRGVVVDQELLDQLLSYVGQRRALNHLRCEHAEFSDIQFARLQLNAMSMGAARFEGSTAFRQVQCTRRAMLQRAEFARLSISDCNFDGGLIGGDCEFGDVVVSGSVLGEMTLFRVRAGTMSFARSQAQLIQYTSATFETLGLQTLDVDALELRGVQCSGGLIVTECSLKAALVRASAHSEVKIADCHFNGSADFDLVSMSEGLWLSKNTFVDRPTVRMASDGLVDMRGNRFYEGADLVVGLGQVALDGTDFRRPSVLATPTDGPRRPRLVSARATDLVNLTVDDLDLAECRFAGAHNLDQLKFNGASLFGEAPRGLRLGLWPVRLARRRVIFEEAAWRSRSGKWWSSLWPAPPQRFWLGGLDDLTPPDIADIYRRLRKAREDRKDGPELPTSTTARWR